MLVKEEAVFRKEKGTDWWDEISEGERKAIEESIDRSTIWRWRKEEDDQKKW